MAGMLGMIFGALLGVGAPGAAFAADPQAPAQDSMAAIEADFQRDTLKLDKARIERMAKLAAGKTGPEADLAYETLFRIAIGSNLYSDAEPTAELVMKSTTVSAPVALLAHLVNIIAEADRGDFTESLKDLEASIKTKKEGQKSSLPVALRLTIVDAYLQRLVQAGQFDIATQALKVILDRSEDPSVKELASQWLKQVELVGKPAPAISGKDIDGKTFQLSDAKGDVVLVVFWATWCLANAQEVAAFEKAYNDHKGKGLKIVGVNVDSFQEDGRSADTINAAVKRYLIEYNIRWPNLIDHPGEGELAKAYGVKDIPSNVLIGRDGKVVQFNLTRANLTKVLAKEMSR